MPVKYYNNVPDQVLFELVLPKERFFKLKKERRWRETNSVIMSVFT